LQKRDSNFVTCGICVNRCAFVCRDVRNFVWKSHGKVVAFILSGEWWPWV